MPDDSGTFSVMKISLCLLTLNELKGCELDCPKIDRTGFDEVFAVDGGSTDGTRDYLKGQNIPVHVQPTKGLSNAHHYAFEISKTDAIVFFHPKGSINPEHIKTFRDYFDRGYELVIATRNSAGGQTEEDGHFFKPRKWGVLALSILASALWRSEGHYIGDVLHGFRGITRKAYQEMQMRDKGVSIDLEAVIRAYRKQVPRIEFPVKEVPRPFGETHFKLLPTGLKLLLYLSKELIR